jgi:hypothetical protein
MKKNLSMLAGVTSLVFAGAAAADFAGLDYEIANSGDLTDLGGNIVAANTWTARIYATFTDAGDSLQAVFGDADSPLSIHSSSGFYQNAFGGPTSKEVNSALYAAFPSLRYDSWATIGLEDSTGNALNNIGIDWTSFNGGGSIETSDGTWFVTPDDAQGTAGSELRVMIAQLTMLENGDGSTGTTFGMVSLQGKTADGTTWSARDQSFDYALPAPGALALLGMAGLAGRRRRRA